MNTDKRTLTREDLRTRLTVSVEEAGALLGLGRAASYEAVHRGTLPVVRVSARRLVVPTAQLLRMLGEEIVFEHPQPSRDLGIQGHYAGPLGVVPGQVR